jgi:hypothetical protein
MTDLAIDDLIYRGHGNDNPAGGRFVTVEAPDGTVVGTLRHVVRHSPTGYTWGYAGSGPADLARSLLIAALGDAAKCTTCRGGRRVLFVDEAGDPAAYDPEDPAHVIIARATEGPLTCWDCEDGYRRLPYQDFKFEYVATWPASWTISRAEILAWLASRGVQP